MKPTEIILKHPLTVQPVNWIVLIQRITVAVVMWPHGAQLLLGWFGGFGFAATMDYFTTELFLPYPVALIVILIQFFGSLFIFAGFLTRFSALSMFIIVIGMILCGHLEHGFFMNWFGNQKGEGFEYHVLLLGLCATLVLTGGGRYSIDHLFFKSKI